jgi:hypothetical protein
MRKNAGMYENRKGYQNHTVLLRVFMLLNSFDISNPIFGLFRSQIPGNR